MDLRLSGAGRVYQVAQAGIEGVHTGLGFLAVRGEQGHVVQAIFIHFLQVQMDDFFCRFLNRGRFHKGEIFSPFQGLVAVPDEFGVGGDAAARLLAENLVQPDYRSRLLVVWEGT